MHFQPGAAQTAQNTTGNKTANSYWLSSRTKTDIAARATKNRTYCKHTGQDGTVSIEKVMFTQLNKDTRFPSSRIFCQLYFIELAILPPVTGKCKHIPDDKPNYSGTSTVLVRKKTPK